MCQWNKSHDRSACMRSNTAKQTMQRLSSAEMQNKIEEVESDLGIPDSNKRITRAKPETARVRAWATLGRLMDSTERIVSVSNETYFASPTNHGSTWYAPTKRSTRIHTMPTNVPPPAITDMNHAWPTKWSPHNRVT